MLRKISAVVVTLLVAGLVWRFGRERGATTPPPPARDATAPVATETVRETEPSRKPETEEPSSPAAERVAVGESERGELSHELPPLGAQHGLLDETVPRPILAGHVWIRLIQGGSEDDPPTYLDFEVPVRADGAFDLADVPPGRGQILALCRGWVSRRTPFDAIEAVTLRLGREPSFPEIEQAFQEEGPETFAPQRIALPARGPLVVAMERTGSLEVSVGKQDGSPLAGASVTASPNVHWIGGSSTIFPWREWTGATDALGRARIDDLPPDDFLTVDAHHDSFRRLRAARDPTPSVKIVSGQTAELRLEFEPKQD